MPTDALPFLSALVLQFSSLHLPGLLPVLPYSLSFARASFPPLSVLLSISIRPGVSAKANAVWLQMKLTQLQGPAFPCLYLSIICVIL